MSHLLFTDFIKNKIIQLITTLGLCIEMYFSQSIARTATLFCLPYSISVLLNYLMYHRKQNKPFARISEQFRPEPPPRIKITPR